MFCDQREQKASTRDRICGVAFKTKNVRQLCAVARTAIGLPGSRLHQWSTSASCPPRKRVLWWYTTAGLPPASSMASLSGICLPKSRCRRRSAPLSTSPLSGSAKTTVQSFNLLAVRENQYFLRSQRSRAFAWAVKMGSAANIASGPSIPDCSTAATDLFAPAIFTRASKSSGSRCRHRCGAER